MFEPVTCFNSLADAGTEKRNLDLGRTFVQMSTTLFTETPELAGLMAFAVATPNRRGLFPTADTQKRPL